MNNLNTATVRTGVNAAVTGVILAGLSRATGINLNLDDPAVIAVAGVGAGVVYRASRWASDRWPTLGYVLFGIPTPPSY